MRLAPRQARTLSSFSSPSPPAARLASAAAAASPAPPAGAGASAAFQTPAPAAAGPVSAAALDALCSVARLVVFDFDLTVLAIHACAQNIPAAAVPSRNLADDFTDLGLFRRIVAGLAARGVGVAIASFGRYEVIQAYMDAAFPAACGGPRGGSAPAGGGRQPGAAGGAGAGAASGVRFTRDTISTPSVVGRPDGFLVPGGKNLQLRELAERLRVDLANVVFFDDDEANVAAAGEAGVRLAVHCPSGLDEGAWRAAVAAARRIAAAQR